MAGRRPTPDALKQLAGYPGKRKPRPGSKPVVQSGDAAAPPIVREDPIARAEWRRLAPSLKLLGLIDATNQQSFAAYCLSWSLFVQAKNFTLAIEFFCLLIEAAESRIQRIDHCRLPVIVVRTASPVSLASLAASAWMAAPWSARRA